MIGLMSKMYIQGSSIFFFQAEDGIRDLVRSRGLGDVYKRQVVGLAGSLHPLDGRLRLLRRRLPAHVPRAHLRLLSLIHI